MDTRRITLTSNLLRDSASPVSLDGKSDNVVLPRSSTEQTSALERKSQLLDHVEALRRRYLRGLKDDNIIDDYLTQLAAKFGVKVATDVETWLRQEDAGRIRNRPATANNSEPIITLATTENSFQEVVN